MSVAGVRVPTWLRLWRGGVSARIEFCGGDVWIGVFWRWFRWGFAGDGASLAPRRTLDVYVCVVPMLPLHIQVGDRRDWERA